MMGEEFPNCIYCKKPVDTTKPGYVFGGHFEGEPTPHWHPECEPKPCPECGGEMRFHESWIEQDGREYRNPKGDKWYCKCDHEEKVT